jgi:hypothetical protein
MEDREMKLEMIIRKAFDEYSKELKTFVFLLWPNLRSNIENQVFIRSYLQKTILK